MRKIWNRTFNVLKISLITFGCFALILVVFSFTSVPYWTRYWLGTHGSGYRFGPECVIMLGGGGMPSEENLIRLYYTAVVGNTGNFPVIVAHPFDSTVYDKIKQELMIRGIDSSRIFFEKSGSNTRAQALNLVKYFPETVHSKIVLVTSPENVLRSVLVFRKLGFTNVGGCPAFGSDMNIDLSFDSNLLGGKKYIPDVGNNLKLRYNFWNYLKLEIICLREFTALGYYKLMGWI